MLLERQDNAGYLVLDATFFPGSSQLPGAGVSRRLQTGLLRMYRIGYDVFGVVGTRCCSGGPKQKQRPTGGTHHESRDSSSLRSLLVHFAWRRL
jgi:hypothetical protein